MASYNKFNNTVQYFGTAGFSLNNVDTLKLELSNTAPVATNSVYSDISANELANGNGYTTGGASLTTVTYTNSTGTSTLYADNVVFTATGSMGPFRYATVYDSTNASKPLIGWWDYGTSITLNSGETFTVSFSGNTPARSVLQLS